MPPVTVQDLPTPLSVEHIPMTCDTKQKLKVPYPLLDNVFFFLLIGQPGSGKSNLLINLVAREGEFYNKQFDRVYIFSPSMHTLGTALKIPKARLHQDVTFLPEILKLSLLHKKVNPNYRMLLVFDDMSHIFRKSGNLREFVRMAQNRRHIGVSVMMVGQKLNKIPLELRSQADALAYFKNTNNTELKVLRDEFLPAVETPQFFELMDTVYRDRHDFLFIRLNEGRMFRNFEQEVVLSHPTTGTGTGTSTRPGAGQQQIHEKNVLHK